jgi:hypothetical protein
MVHVQGHSHVTPRAGRGRTVFAVRLRAERGIAEDEAVRALRTLLKTALRRFGLRCVSVWEETVMAEAQVPVNTNSEFRMAVARAIKVARDTVLSPAVASDRKVREMGDAEWSWVAMAIIGVWTQSQRDSIAQAPNGAGFIERLLEPLGALEGFNWDVPIGAWPPEMVVKFLTRVLALTVELKIPVPPFFATGKDPLAEIIDYGNHVPDEEAGPLADKLAGDGTALADKSTDGIVCQLALAAANPLRPDYAQYRGASFGHKPLREMAPLQSTPFCMMCNVERECNELTLSRIPDAKVA